MKIKKRVVESMQPCFTPVWHRKAGVSIFSIFTDDYHWSTLNVKSQGSAPLLPLASIFETPCNSNSNKLLYLHDRIILQNCKSIHMTIKI